MLNSINRYFTVAQRASNTQRETDQIIDMVAQKHKGTKSKNENNSKNKTKNR